MSHFSRHKLDCSAGVRPIIRVDAVIEIRLAAPEGRDSRPAIGEGQPVSLSRHRGQRVGNHAVGQRQKVAAFTGVRRIGDDADLIGNHGPAVAEG